MLLLVFGYWQLASTHRVFTSVHRFGERSSEAPSLMTDNRAFRQMQIIVKNLVAVAAVGTFSAPSCCVSLTLRRFRTQRNLP
jgi:hypothetical protein